MIPPSLLARAAALRLLGAVLGDGRPLDEALAAESTLARLASRDRAFAELLVRTTLRRLGEIDAVLDAVLAEPGRLRPPEIRDLLRLGTCQLLFLKTPSHAAVDTAVDLAAARAPKLKGLVNAVLRRLAREGAGLLAARDAPRLDTPAWLWRRWSAQYGEAAARAIAESHLCEPPLDLTCRREPERWAERLKGHLLPGGTVRLAKAGAVSALPGYAEGAWWVQDLAAAWPAHLLGPVEGERVLDLCAAPGGKTAQLAAAGAKVTAIERAQARFERLEVNLARLGLAAELRLADALTFAPERPFPFVLLDAPCSGTGTIRRHPDLPWRRKEAEIAALVARQEALLEAALRVLAPGGRLVYSVCSLEREEGEERIEALLARRPDLAREAVAPGELGGLAEAGPFLSPAGDFRSFPYALRALGGCDGFYAARLRLMG